MANHSPAMSDWTASTSSPLIYQEKPTFNDAVYPSLQSGSMHDKPPSDPLLAPHPLENKLDRFRQYQRYTQIFIYIHDLASVGVTVYMDAIMIYVLFKYYTTRNIPAPNRTSPWASGTTLWPTFVLLVASSMTMILDISSLVALCCCTDQKRGKKIEGRFSNIGHVVFMVKWVAVLILYRIGKTSKDLWGWSCDERAASIQQFYRSELDFKSLCLNQTVSWVMTFVEVLLKFLLLVIIFVLSRKVKRMKSSY